MACPVSALVFEGWLASQIETVPRVAGPLWGDPSRPSSPASTTMWSRPTARLWREPEGCATAADSFCEHPPTPTPSRRTLFQHLHGRGGTTIGTSLQTWPLVPSRNSRGSCPTYKSQDKLHPYVCARCDPAGTFPAWKSLVAGLSRLSARLPPASQALARDTRRPPLSPPLWAPGKTWSGGRSLLPGGGRRGAALWKEHAHWTGPAPGARKHSR